jgi:hypothetical protein
MVHAGVPVCGGPETVAAGGGELCQELLPSAIGLRPPAVADEQRVNTGAGGQFQTDRLTRGRAKDEPGGGTFERQRRRDAVVVTVFPAVVCRARGLHADEDGDEILGAADVKLVPGAGRNVLLGFVNSLADVDAGIIVRSRSVMRPYAGTVSR